MIETETAAELESHVGESIGASDWVRIEQENVDRFADLTGDRNWIHVDVERARKEMPDGRTIAHGLYVLSLGPSLKDQVYRVRRRARGLNYGYDRVRFVRPVQTGDWIRLVLTVAAVTPHRRGTRIDMVHDFEARESGAVAVSAHNILLIETPDA